MKRFLVLCIFCSVALGNCGKKGCTDPTAINYDSSAKKDNGSCILIGDNYEGGIVFYGDGLGGGLVATTADLSTAAEWGCYGTDLNGSDGTAIGTGYQNTIDLEAGCTNPGTAADICANITLGGYSDWFLPSIFELELMYDNIGHDNSFSENLFWSSTEVDNIFAYTYNFHSITCDATETIKPERKNMGYYSVRAVRAF
jgi:hypothetical protein